jgi:hypothetical protein
VARDPLIIRDLEPIRSQPMVSVDDYGGGTPSSEHLAPSCVKTVFETVIGIVRRAKSRLPDYSVEVYMKFRV